MRSVGGVWSSGFSGRCGSAMPAAVEIGARKLRLGLAVLLARAGQAVPTDIPVEAVWGRGPAGVAAPHEAILRGGEMLLPAAQPERAGAAVAGEVKKLMVEQQVSHRPAGASAGGVDHHGRRWLVGGGTAGDVHAYGLARVGIGGGDHGVGAEHEWCGVGVGENG